MGKYSRKCYLCSASQINKIKSTISLYQFPRDSVTRSLWMNFCNLFETDDVSLLKICSRHFQTSDFIEPRALEFGNRLILKNGAIPSIYKPRHKQRESDPLLHKTESTLFSPPYESSTLMCRSLNVIDRQVKPDNQLQISKESKEILETEKLCIKTEPVFICPSYESSTSTCQNVINRQNVPEDNFKVSEKSENLSEMDTIIKTESEFIYTSYEPSPSACQSLNVLNRQSVLEDNLKVSEESENILETDKILKTKSILCPPCEPSTSCCQSLNVINRQSVPEENLKVSEESESILETDTIIKIEPILCPPCEPSTSICQSLNIINRKSVPEDNLKVSKESEKILETNKVYIKTEPEFICPTYESSTSICQSLNVINRQSVPEDNLKVSKESENFLETNKLYIKTEPEFICPIYESSTSLCQSLNVINRQSVPEENLKVSGEPESILETNKVYIKTEPRFICPTYESSTSLCQSLNVVNRQSIPEENLKVSEESEDILETGSIIKTESILCSSYEQSTLLCQNLDTIHRRIEPEDILQISEESQNVLRTETMLESSQHINCDEYGCCTAKRRRFAKPRYIDDVNSCHLGTPEQTERTLKLAKSIIAKKTMKIQSLQQTTRRLKKRIAVLKKSSSEEFYV